MNCDDAFDRLTSLDSSDDGLLEAHLAECPRCRAMQETLSPAIAWLVEGGEAAPDWESSAESPAWHLSTEAVQIAEQACRRLQTETTAESRSVGVTSRLERWGMLAAAALFACCAIWLPPERPTKNVPSTLSTPEVTSCTWQTDLRRDRTAPGSAPQVIASCAACHFTTP